MNPNALIICSQELMLRRSRGDEPFASLPWDDIHELSLAMAGDLLTNVSHVARCDVHWYHGPSDNPEGLFRSSPENVVPRESAITERAELFRSAIQSAFADHYERVIVLLENQPTYAPPLFDKLFSQLNFEDECIVVGPTLEGKCYLIGMKTDYSRIFSGSSMEELLKPYELLRKLCDLPCELFLAHERASLDSGYMIEELKRELSVPGARDVYFPYRTYEVFRKFDKLYKPKYSFR